MVFKYHAVFQVHEHTSVKGKRVFEGNCSLCRVAVSQILFATRRLRTADLKSVFPRAQHGATATVGNIGETGASCNKNNTFQDCG